MARVLVVEDDASISMGLEMNLAAEGYEVRLASDGAEPRPQGLVARGAYDDSN